MSKLQFSWKNQKGYGLALLFFGWSLIIQIPAFYQNYLVIKPSSQTNDWLIFLAIIIMLTALIGSILATIFENVYDPFDSTLINAHTIVLVSFIIFYVFYLLTVPSIQTIEPFLAIPTKIPLIGWGEFMLSIAGGILGLTIFWYISTFFSSNSNN